MRIHIVAGLLAILALVGCQDVGATASRAAGGDSASRTATVPDVVGSRLSDARERLTAAGFRRLKSTDATGKGRVVVNSQNWIVRSQSPAAGGKAAIRATITLAVSKPSDSAGTAGAVAGVVPKVVCEDLQTAQNALQAAGFFNLGSQDGTGQGRTQLVDRNWVVVKQSAAAGSRPDVATRIVLIAVKFGEPTGGSGCRS